MKAKPEDVERLIFIFTDFNENIGVGHGKDDPCHKIPNLWRAQNKIGNKIKEIVTKNIPTYCSLVVRTYKSTELQQLLSFNTSKIDVFHSLWLLKTENQFLTICKKFRECCKKYYALPKADKKIARAGRDGLDQSLEDPDESPEREASTALPIIKFRATSQGTECKKDYHSRHGKIM